MKPPRPWKVGDPLEISRERFGFAERLRYTAFLSRLSRDCGFSPTQERQGIRLDAVIMKKIWVIKHDGVKEPYDQGKVLNSILRSGIPKNIALEVLSKVESQLFDLISTTELYRIVSRVISQHGLSSYPHVYRLREALAIMGSFDFEKFVQNILSHDNYDAKWNQIISGLCIEHQVDVLARNKQGKFFYVEVKHHQNFHRDCDLGTVIEVWGRFEDLKNGYQNSRHQIDLANCWLITNTKFSAHAKDYALCKKIKLTGWRYSTDDDGIAVNDNGLEELLKNLGIESINQSVDRVLSSR